MMKWNGLSVVVPVSDRTDDVETLYRAYKRGVEAVGKPYQFIYVLDGEKPKVLSALKDLRQSGEPIEIVALARWFGEATALTVGFSHARGDIILTLPAYMQIEPEEIPKLVAGLEGYDLVIARRYPRVDSKLNVLQSYFFHMLIGWMVDVGFHDLGCGVRVLRRPVIEELVVYGDQHRFLPLLAHRIGFKVREMEARQAKADAYQRVYPLGVYVRRVLDILTITFIVKFTKKPLRFFGLIGSLTFVIGGLGTVYLAFERLFLGVPLADRPALVLAVLMIVLGFQMIAVGLIGELIIFTHAKDLKEYVVERIVEFRPKSQDRPPRVAKKD